MKNNNLRPISQLIEEIEYNGEKFIPLQKLFNMVEDYNYIDYIDLFDSKYKIKYQIDDDWNHCMIISNKYIKLEFCYDKWGQAFNLLAADGESWETLNVSPQYPLFKAMLEWGFDIELSNETSDEEWY